MRIWALLFLFFLGAAPAQAAEPVASLPFRIDYEGWITVNATIDGNGPYDFIVDTGATVTAVFENLAEISDFQRTGQAPRHVLGLVGTGLLDPYKIGDVALGAAILPDHAGVILPDWEKPRRTPAGIIGLDFLKQYAVYFDHRRQMMVFYPHGGIPDSLTNKLEKVKLRTNSFGSSTGALYMVRGTLNRARINFIVDLGSASTLINYEAAQTLYRGTVVSNGLQGFTTGSRLKDAFDNRAKAQTAFVHQLRVGNVFWRDIGIWVYDSPLFDELDIQRLPYGLMGADLVLDRDFALDFGENELFIQRRSN